MWLGQYQRRPNQEGEGQVGRVTIGGEQTAVLLDSERRGLEVYAPGGYRWTPRVDKKVLVIQGRGEIPCVVGVRQDQTAPDEVTVESPDSHFNLAAEGAELIGGRIDLMGQVYINGEKLEELIARIAAMMMG